MASRFILRLAFFIDAERPQGVWGTIQKCACGYPNAVLAKHTYPKMVAIKPGSHINSYKFQSESVLVHFPKRVTQTP